MHLLSGSKELQWYCLQARPLHSRNLAICFYGLLESCLKSKDEPCFGLLSALIVIFYDIFRVELCKCQCSLQVYRLEHHSLTGQDAISSLLQLRIFVAQIEGHLGAYFKEVKDREHTFSLFSLLILHFQITWKFLVYHLKLCHRDCFTLLQFFSSFFPVDWSKSFSLQLLSILECFDIH